MAAPSPAPKSIQDVQEVPLKIVGGTHFGRYPKISLEETWNFIVSDGFLVPYAGYKNVLNLTSNVAGRGIYSSYVGNFMLVVIGASVYTVKVNFLGTLESTFIGNLQTTVGDVFISENNNGEIALTDGVFLYVYNYLTTTVPLLRSSDPSTANPITFPFKNPGYISFQNGRLIVAVQDTTNWVLSDSNKATSWSTTSPFVGSIQTKPDFCQGAIPVPGGGNNLLVFGRNVTEVWQDVGAALFPYQRNSTFNIDYGCLNAASLAHLKDITVWLAVNEQSGPVLMVAHGSGGFEAISTDGIDYQLSNLKKPENCTGFLYQQDGHVIYQFSFPTDNISYAYDFNTKLFFNVSDENLNYHIAREVVYFNNTYYFVSLNGGNVYEFDTLFTSAQYADDDIRQIPRIRICPPLRMSNQRYFIGKSLGFTIEQGQPNTVRIVNQFPNSNISITTESSSLLDTENSEILITEQKSTVANASYYYTSEQVNLAISRDGGETFGSFWGQDMNQTGNFKSRFIYQRLGIVNDATFQLRFNGFGRFVCTDGVVEVYQ